MLQPHSTEKDILKGSSQTPAQPQPRKQSSVKNIIGVTEMDEKDTREKEREMQHGSNKLQPPMQQQSQSQQRQGNKNSNNNNNNNIVSIDKIESDDSVISNEDNEDNHSSNHSVEIEIMSDNNNNKNNKNNNANNVQNNANSNKNKNQNNNNNNTKASNKKGLTPKEKRKINKETFEQKSQYLSQQNIKENQRNMDTHITNQALTNIHVPPTGVTPLTAGSGMNVSHPHMCFLLCGVF